jgi:hypothetical protein
MIDDQTVAIDFYDPSMLNRGANIEYTKEYFENNDIIDTKTVILQILKEKGEVFKNIL